MLYLYRTISVFSKLFDAFSHYYLGMTVYQAIETGFEGVFVPLSEDGTGTTAVEEKSLYQ